MLSVLIPVYNYDVLSLVEEIQAQASKCNIVFEVLAFDDGSNSVLNKKNETVNLLDHCIFKELPLNVGRSAMRNLLGTHAQYDNLLFIDAGTFPKSKNFIRDYLKTIDHQVVIGGMTCLEQPPKKPFKMRWLYTKKREADFKNGKVFCSSNFLIKKGTFQSYPFDESIKKYGCEDVVFFSNLIKNNISITYIENPVIHDSSDDANSFVKKTEDAIENLITLIGSKKLSNNAYKISMVYDKLQNIHLDKLVSFIYLKSKPFMLKNFNSSNPSLFLYDFYRLGHYCLLKNKK